MAAAARALAALALLAALLAAPARAQGAPAMTKSMPSAAEGFTEARATWFEVRARLLRGARPALERARALTLPPPSSPRAAPLDRLLRLRAPRPL